MKDKAEEKRVFTRLNIDADVGYRVIGEDKDNKALLDNISAGGVLFWSVRQLAIGTSIHLSIGPDQMKRPPIQIMATVVSIRTPRQDGQFGYGCRIDVTKNAKDSLTCHDS
jgi:hypothetical protein